jgi:hypothetical protein
VVGSSDQAVAGTKVGAFHVATSKGDDITSLVNATHGAPGWWGSPGDTVLIDMDPPQAGFHAQSIADGGDGGMLEGDPKDEELRYAPPPTSRMKQRATAQALATDYDWLTRTGVIVQRPDDQGGWTDITQWYPRQYADATYLPGLGHGTTRLVFVGSHRLSFVGRLESATRDVNTATLLPASAIHSRLGDVKAAVGASSDSTIIAPGDTVTLTFGVPAVAEGMVRDYVLVTRGVYTSHAPTARLQPGTGLPTIFALLQNRPNPFGATTTIRFDLPVATIVKIEIFDLFGRRVKTLTDARWPAGYQHVEWDRRTDSGAMLRSGVYMYRITAGSFRDRRKLVIVGR